MTDLNPSIVSYFPLTSGRYEVKVGLHTFGMDFGNGGADRKLFQIDENFAHYRQAKLAARSERLSKYYQLHRYSLSVAREIASFVAQQLAQEHPDFFVRECLTRDRTALHCSLTSEVLVFDSDMKLIESTGKVNPPYASSFDALACQVQEDLAVMRLSSHDWLSAAHICFPNHWGAEAKIGCGFADIHRPVPGIERISANARLLVTAMVNQGPYVRFVWGLATDTRLNHHPDPPPGFCERQWNGRLFDTSQPQLWLRVERQASWGFPGVTAALFTIRTYLMDCHTIKNDPGKRSKLISAIDSMGPEALHYKGMVHNRENILAWLRSP
ncbi:MAG: heme-dependent oxidative N-demethylase subunit alpha family protein [Acidiferrobacterales bacterium]